MQATALRKPATKAKVKPPQPVTPTRTLPRQVQMKSGCSCGGGCPSCQAREDRFEREADAAADQVMRKAAPPVLSAAEEGPMRETGQDMEETGEALPETLRPIQSGGHPLPPDLNRFFSDGFGHDFSNVRLHHDSKAGRSARGFGARAYTYGRHIAFASGEYVPTSAAGRHLIAHELAHVVQQGQAPRRNIGSDKGLSSAPIGIQRACGPREITEAPGCIGTGDDIFGEPILFNVNCDTFREGGEGRSDQENRLRELARGLLGSAAVVDVHGFASMEGDATFNYNLSCVRANRAAQILRELGVVVGQLYAHGATIGPAEPRRSVVLDPRSEPEPEPGPEPTPEPIPEPTPSPDFSGCGGFEDAFRFITNVDPSLPVDLISCVCEGIKLADILESVAQFAAGPIFPDGLSDIIENLDGVCNFLDWLQLIYITGADGGCWSLSNLTSSDIARITTHFAAFVADLFSQQTANWAMDQLSDLLFELLVAEGAAAGSYGGPVGAVGGAALGALIAVLARIIFVERAAEIADFILDLSLYLSQNQLTHGTIFPLDSCRSCLRLPSYFGGPDFSGRCDELNRDWTPERMRVPEWHGSATGDTGGEE